MGRKVKRNIRLLEAAFSRGEWEYLKRHEEFKRVLKNKNVTLADFEKLSLLGDRLLMKWEKANPSKPNFRRVSKLKSTKKAEVGRRERRQSAETRHSRVSGSLKV